MGLIGSSGKGGATLHRRNWGEAVESLTGGEYYWMVGNYMKYGASDAVFGARTAQDLPVDSHELIALCAPRLTFISYGVPERGDARGLDHQGGYMAAGAAGRVFKLLGARGSGVTVGTKQAVGALGGTDRGRVPRRHRPCPRHVPASIRHPGKAWAASALGQRSAQRAIRGAQCRPAGVRHRLSRVLFWANF